MRETDPRSVGVRPSGGGPGRPERGAGPTYPSERRGLGGGGSPPPHPRGGLTRGEGDGASSRGRGDRSGPNRDT